MWNILRLQWNLLSLYSLANNDRFQNHPSKLVRTFIIWVFLHSVLSRDILENNFISKAMERWKFFTKNKSSSNPSKCTPSFTKEKPGKTSTPEWLKPINYGCFGCWDITHGCKLQGQKFPWETKRKGSAYNYTKSFWATWESGTYNRRLSEDA